MSAIKFHQPNIPDVDYSDRIHFGFCAACNRPEGEEGPQKILLIDGFCEVCYPRAHADYRQSRPKPTPLGVPAGDDIL